MIGSNFETKALVAKAMKKQTNKNHRLKYWHQRRMKSGSSFDNKKIEVIYLTVFINLA